MRMRAALCSFVLILSAPSLASAAPAKPSFDCSKASSDVEKTICSSTALAKADADVASVYRERRREFSPAAASLLAQDETWFLAARDRVFGYNMGEPAKLLRDLLADRVQFLSSLRIPSGDALTGTWSNVANTVIVVAEPDGRLSIDVNGNEPVTARWVCGFQGAGTLANGILEIKDADGSRLRLSRDGQTLSVQTLPPPNKTSWTPNYCGMNGSVEGNYFAVSQGAK